MKQYICALLAAVLLLTALASCGGAPNAPAETVGETTAKAAVVQPSVTEEEELSTDLPEDVARITKEALADYVIIYPAQHSDDLAEAVAELQSGIARSYNVNLQIKTDDVAPTDCEILVGNTNRAESALAVEGYRYSDCCYCLLGQKLVITGYSEEYTVLALARFRISHVLTTNQTPYFYTADKDKQFSAQSYAHDEILLNGVNILRYRLVYPKADKALESELALMLRNAVIQSCGYQMEVVSDEEDAAEYEILIGKTNRTVVPTSLGDANDVGVVAVYEKNILLCGNCAAGNASAVNILLDKLLATQEGTETTASVSLTDQTVSVYGEDGEMSAMSFNVLVGDITNRRDSVIGTILKYLPDTVGVQEVSVTWLNALKATLSDYYYFVGFGRESTLDDDGNVTQNRGEGTYILYAKDKFDLIYTKTEWLSATPDVPKSKYDGQEYLRVVTWAVLRRKSDGATFVHCNTHLDFDNSIQTKEVLQITKRLKSFTDAGIPVIITGDFNMTDKASAFSVYGAMGYTDSKTVADETGTVGATFPGGGLVIDFAMCNDFLTVHYYTVVSELIGKVQSSDHYPIYIRFSY